MSQPPIASTIGIAAIESVLEIFSAVSQKLFCCACIWNFSPELVCSVMGSSFFQSNGGYFSGLVIATAVLNKASVSSVRVEHLEARAIGSLSQDRIITELEMT